VTYTSCTREGCQVVATGKCLEGFDPPPTCPYLSSADVSAIDVASAEPSFADLPSGEALTQAQASEITRQGITRVIVLAGPSGSGKTTILTSLFEAFLQAPFGNFLFAGSRTLVGFERRCHDARIVSGRPEPHTVHTSVEAIDFLHLRLTSPVASPIGAQHLLLSDISGERFRALRDSSAAVAKMPMLRRADNLCIVLDGEKLADANQRHAVRNDARTLLRSLIEGNALSADCKIGIVFSKWDLVLANASLENVMSFIADTKTALLDTLRHSTIPQFFEIAARPNNSKVPFAFGLPTLLRYWLQQPSVLRLTLYMPSINDTRETTRFARSVVQRQQLGDLYDVQWV
jgi:hypothetical protein